MEQFIQTLMKNLEKNGFPTKKVAFDLETLYEKAEEKKISLNNVLDELKKNGVDHVKKGERIIFKQGSTATKFADVLSGIDSDFLAQAQEMMDGMDEDGLAATRTMVEERLASMSETERNQLFKQIKGMGLG